MDRNCLNNSACTSPGSCACTIAPGLGEKILSAVAERLEKQSTRKTSEMVSDELKPYWKEYGELVAAWCCGAHPIVAI